MKRTKVFITGLVLGLVFGLWGGINIGKGRPLYANPLVNTPVEGKLRDAGHNVVRKSGEALQQTGEDLKKAAGSNP